VSNPQALAIVVLGARVLPDGRPGQALRRRVQRAAQAYHAQLAPLLVCSGGRAWSGHIEAERMRDQLVQLGVAPSAILLELRSRSTAQNARFSSDLLRDRGVSAAIVVTCPWHMPRAIADFCVCGLSAVGLPADTPPVPWPHRLWRCSLERACRSMDRARLLSGWV
jgi:uncharacterized SAM-binding protein YcdF (DUF218 family)